jgi:hypothetical protein
LLIDRLQRVCVAGAEPTWAMVTSGVPQSSILGTILFLIYINDIGARKVNHLLKFANDTKLIGSVGSQADTRSLQDDVDIFSQ